VKSFWNRPRVVALVALAVPFSAVAFAGVQYFDGTGASASDCPVATACASAAPARLTATPIRRLTPVTRPRPRAIPKSAVKRTPPRVATPRVLTATPPTTCASVVASVAWPPRWQVRCEGARAGLLGVTQPTGLTELFVRTDQTTSTLRMVALHESGHAWDFARLGPRRIERWCASRGCDAARFFSGGVSSEGWAEPSGAEDWAAVWDACHGGVYDRSYMGLAAPLPGSCALQNTLVNYPR
jgi:hypothetical protein